jgi:hypothetical protein
MSTPAANIAAWAADIRTRTATAEFLDQTIAQRIISEGLRTALAGRSDREAEWDSAFGLSTERVTHAPGTPGHEEGAEASCHRSVIGAFGHNIATWTTCTSNTTGVTITFAP